MMAADAAPASASPATTTGAINFAFNVNLLR
jgi:hypothetical protein